MENDAFQTGIISRWLQVCSPATTTSHNFPPPVTFSHREVLLDTTPDWHGLDAPDFPTLPKLPRCTKWGPRNPPREGKIHIPPKGANVGKYSISSWWCSSHFKHMLVKLDHSQVGVNISIFEASHRLVFLWGRQKTTVKQRRFSYASLAPLKSNEPGTWKMGTPIPRLKR